MQTLFKGKKEKIRKYLQSIPYYLIKKAGMLTQHISYSILYYTSDSTKNYPIFTLISTSVQIPKMKDSLLTSKEWAKSLFHILLKIKST